MQNLAHTKTLVSSIARLALVSVMCAAGALAQAQDFPSKPITIIAPSPPGGGFDLIGRMVADGLSKTYNKTVLTENRIGSGTLVGTQYVASAPADGYTLIVGGQSNLVFNSVLYKTLKYDARTDFVNLGMVATYPYLMVARADLPVQSFKALMDLIRAQPDTLTIATAGTGTAQHILAAAFVKATGAKVTMVPYKGAAAAYQDILGGRVDLFIDAWPTVRTQLAGKRIKPLLSTGAQRMAALPDVPVVKEVGLPKLENESWFGIFAPSKTPPAAVQWLRTGLAAVTRSPEWKARMEKTGMEELDMSLPAADKYIAGDFDKWTGFIRQANIVAE